MPKEKKEKKIKTTKDLPPIDKSKSYTIEEAVNLAKAHAKEKFDATLELHVRLGINPKHTDQQIRATVSFPHAFGKSKKVMAFVTPDKEKEAKEAGADFIGNQEVIDTIKQTGKIDFDVAISTPDMMKNLAVIARILGPKGLMPSPKNDTISMDIKRTVAEIKKGKTAYKNDDTSNVHIGIGKVSQDVKAVAENFEEIISSLKKNKPSSSKGIFLRAITLCSTMGPAIKVEIPK